MVRKGSDVLLGPGMNIHRSPLCGRNFEYFSEDPAPHRQNGRGHGARHPEKRRLPPARSTSPATTRRRTATTVTPAFPTRALREIYLKGFEICVKEGKPQNIMTSYNKINGVWGHYHYDLCTTVLRGEWGFGGSVMTDWWMRLSPDPDFPQVWDSAYRIRAGVNVLMPGGLDQQGTPRSLRARIAAQGRPHAGRGCSAAPARCSALWRAAGPCAALDAEGLPKLPERVTAPGGRASFPAALLTKPQE